MVKRISAIILTFLVCLMSLGTIAPRVVAEVAEKSIQVICESDGETLSGMTWRIYRVGDCFGNTDANNFELSGDFAWYPVNMLGLTGSRWQDAADTLENYAIVDGVEPLDKAVTDKNGIINFESLESGLYLLSGSSIIVNDVKYTPAPILIEVTDDSLTLDMTTYPKFTLLSVLGAKDVQFSVQKIWQGDEIAPSARATQIEVELYKDGEYQSTAILSAENDWTYTWSGNEIEEWRVRETSVVENYSVVNRSDGNQFVIVNSYEGVADAVVTPAPTETTTVDVAAAGVTPKETTTTTTTTVVETEIVPVVATPTSGGTTTSSGTKLPQTGQLWWPVPVLLLVGVIFLCIAFRLRKKVR